MKVTMLTMLGLGNRTRLNCLSFASTRPRYISMKSVEVTESASLGSTAPRGYICSVDTGYHRFITDKKKDEGGEGAAASPKDLLLASLGGCTVMTIRTFYENTMAANSTYWAGSTLTNINVILEEKYGANPHIPVGISMEIVLDGELTTYHKSRLMSAAANCPVKKMITGNTAIEAVLIDSQ